MSNSTITVPANVDAQQFLALARLRGEDKAREFFAARTPAAPSERDELIAVGMTPEEADAALGLVATPEPEVSAADALLAASPYERKRGKVYTHKGLIEAQARVLRTGKPEIVQAPGHPDRAVLVAKEKSGDASMQNLYLPKSA